MPARNISRCETICASLGFWRNSGRKYWDRSIRPRDFRVRRQSSIGPRVKIPPAMKKLRDLVRRFAYCRGISKIRRQLAWPEFREVLKLRPEMLRFRE